jgi:predicted RNA-binding Zn-ribbon protein involved in translation (DUF1610 family)
MKTKKLTKSISMILALLITLSIASIGAISANADFICPNCHGLGQTTQTIQTSGGTNIPGGPGFSGVYIPPSYTTIHTPCPTCGGTGRIRTGSSSSYRSSSDSSSSSSSSEEGGANSVTAKESYTKGVIAAGNGAWDNECAGNILDGNKETKFCYITPSSYIIWDNGYKGTVTGYSITTANDNAVYKGRNPRDWTLYGSNKKLDRDNKKWVKIAEVKKDKKLKNKNFKKYSYKVKKQKKAYRYFRLEITKNKGDRCTQLSEFTLKTKEGKKMFVLKDMQKDHSNKNIKLTLKWKKIKGVTGYQIQFANNEKYKGKKSVSTKTLKKTLTLSDKKSWFIRARTYKKKGSKTTFSPWTTIW